MKQFGKFLKVHIEKVVPSQSGRKILRRRGLSLLLAVLLVVSVINPLFGLLVQESKAEPILYTGNTLDGSTGVADISWYHPEDSDAGATEATAYVIKNADQLAGLANIVNGDAKNGDTAIPSDNFQDKYIRLEGLTQEEADSLAGTNSDAQAGVIDLRKYNGDSGSATKNVYWVPIGKTESNPFSGTLFSTDKISVINLNFAAEEDLDCYGLVGYNHGTVRDFSISYTVYGTTDSVKTGLDFSSGSITSLKYIGSAVAYNAASGLVSNITVGIGGQVYNSDETFSFDKSAVLDSNIFIQSAFLNMGGVVGATEGNVSGCSFYGSITTSFENNVAAHSQESAGGIGGIVGFAGNNSGSNISDCVVKINIEVAQVGESNAYGGIVGKVAGFGTIISCVAYGSIAAKNAGNDKSTDSQFGGIGGRVASSVAVSKCISAVDITVERYSAQANVEAKAPAVVGGVVGTLVNTSLERCFSIGTLSGKTAVGGLVGNLQNSISTVSINNSYSSCAVTIASNITADTEYTASYGVGQVTDYESASGVHAAGGLVGLVGSPNAVVKNTYFSGSTLKSEVGSIYGGVAGDAAYTAGENVFFDSQVSPNRAFGANRSPDKDTNKAYEKTTVELQSLAFTDSFTVGSNIYPALNWVNSNPSPVENVNRLAKAFSAVSTATYLNQNETYGNSYRAKSVGEGSSVLNKNVDTDQVQYESSWKTAVAYKGIQKVETLGGVYSLGATVTPAVGEAYVINIQRKLLLPVNTDASSSADADQISNEASFKRFLDISNVASGAYIGGVFALSADLDDLKIEAVVWNDTLQMMDNLFCATLEGNSHRINSISFSETSAGLFGAALSGKIQNFTVSSVELGTAAKPYDLISYQYKYAGLFCAYAKSTAFQDVVFDDVFIVLDNSGSKCFGFGMLTGYNAPGSVYSSVSSFNNISVNQANVTIKKLGSVRLDPDRKAYGLSLGLLGGELYNNDLTNSKIARLTFITEEGTCKTLGSFVGNISIEGNSTDKSKVDNCTVENLNATIGGTGTYNNKSGFGGIGGSIAVSISNCAVSGIINSSFTTSSTSNSSVAGITVFMQNGKKISNCTFSGSIIGFGFSGGLAAYTNWGISIEKSNVYGTVESDAKFVDSYAGGIIAYISAGGNKIIESYFLGNVTGSYAGGLVGRCANNDLGSIDNSYAKAIVTGTTSGTYIGGLFGKVDKKITAKNCYFAGQLRGEGNQGGIAGFAVDTAFTNVLFDKSIAGNKIATVASISTTDTPDNHPGADLNAVCSVTSSEITKNKLGSSFSVESDTNYPALVTEPGASFVSAETKAALSDLSTRKVFLVQAYNGNEGVLTSWPSFRVDSSNASIIVNVDDANKNIVALQEGAYIPKMPGFTTAMVANTLPDGASIQMVYDIVFVPFDYGKGTEDSPYIIYNAAELKKFKDYVDGGFDTENTWYKIGSVENEAIIGDPIAIDLRDSGSFTADWEPIRNFKGHLEGNNSVLANLSQSTPWVDASSVNYFGLFATSSGNIKNLTLNTVEINTSNTTGTIFAGSLVARASGGNYISCNVLNDKQAQAEVETLRQPNQIFGKTATAVGGLIGYLDILAGITSNVQACTVLANISYTGNVANGTGGVVGYVSLANNTSVLNVDQTSSYGSAKGNNTALGGIVGGTNSLVFPITISNCVSTMDLTVLNKSAFLGGILAGRTPGTDALPSAIKFKNCYYGGKFAYPEAIQYIGGIAAITFLYKDFLAAGKGHMDSYDGTKLIDPGILYENAEEVLADINALYQNKTMFEDCAFNFNINRVPVASTAVRCHFELKDDKDGIYRANNANYVVSRDISMEIIDARSSTQAMTDGTRADDSYFVYDKGYYPIPTRLVNAADDSLTQQNEAYLNYMARFYSAAVYYTNADQFGDNTYSNIYLLTPSGDNIGEFLDVSNMSGAKDKVVVTENGKMVQSIDTAGSTVTLPLVGSYLNRYTFKKELTFVPSVIACGVSDSSFVYANPEGMWVSSDSTVQYPWTIYTADQLQGLTAVVNNIADGNGIIPGDVKYNQVSLPSSLGADASKGDTFVIGRDLDCANYSVFAPVCPDHVVVENGTDQSKPFDSQLNGLGHVIINLNITRAVSEGEKATDYTKLGLFGQASGAEFKNFGLVNLNLTGGVLYDSNSDSVGSIAGELKNSVVENCFSALPVIGTGKAGQSIGGLIGKAVGTNTVKNSFFTGVLYAASSEGTTNVPDLGGVLGNAINGTTTVADIYVAGFVQTTGKTAAIAPAGTVNVSGCYYDLNATGDLPITNGASPVNLSVQQPEGFLKAVDGFYPLQDVFDASGKAVKAATAKVYLTNARSATGGSIKQSTGFQLALVDSYHGVASKGTIDLAADELSFTQSDSGFIFLNAGRLVAADLKCWYNNGILENGKMIYTINTAKELLEFAMIVNGTLTASGNPNGNHDHKGAVPFDFSNCDVRLGSDIDLADLGESYVWQAAGSELSNAFKGTFDGNGHVLTMNSNAQELFHVVEGSVIKNLGLNGTIDAAGKNEVTPLVNQANGNSTITGCFSSVDIVNAANAAGLVGELSAGSQLQNSYNMGAIKGNGNLAGLVLTNNGVIENCYNVGVITSLDSGVLSGNAAGIALNNGSGSVSNCLNASYISAKIQYAIANSGSIAQCAYDQKLMDEPSDAGSLTKGISSDFGDTSNWISGDNNAFYPQLAIFAGAGALSEAFKTASALSALILRFTGTNYQEFSNATIWGRANGRNVELDPSGYDMSMQENEYTLSNSSGVTGAQTIVTSAAGFFHGYYTNAKATMKIRYKFDFSGLFAENLNQNVNYNTGVSSPNSWDSNSATSFIINTADDFNNFITYVNKGNDTTGKIFKLNNNIDFGGAALAAVTKPFNGTFDGGYYTLSNFEINGSGSAALFSEIGETGRVENLELSKVSVTVDLQAGAPETSGAVIALNNMGFIGNVALIDCSLKVNNNTTTSSSSYVGFLAAKNNGRITGCYAKNMVDLYALSTDASQPDYSGSMVGYNRGTLSGCYFVGEITQIYLLVGANEGQIYNCYYASKEGQGQIPAKAKGAYRSLNTPVPTIVPIENYWLTHAQMQESDFASWLSSNIYAGTYDVGSAEAFIGGSGGTPLNDGFPYLTGFELVKYNLAAYFADRTTMLLSVWNTSQDETTGSISNGIFALDNLQFKYFSDIIMNAKLEFNMHELPNGIDYRVSNARVYANNAQYKSYLGAGGATESILLDFPQTEWNTSLTAESKAWEKVSGANLVVVTIQFKGNAAKTPWGNYRTWSSTTGIETVSEP